MVLSNYNMTARYKLHLSNLAVGQRFNKIVPDRPSHGTLTQQSLYRLPSIRGASHRVLYLSSLCR